MKTTNFLVILETITFKEDSVQDLKLHIALNVMWPVGSKNWMKWTAPALLTVCKHCIIEILEATFHIRRRSVHIFFRIRCFFFFPVNCCVAKFSRLLSWHPIWPQNFTLTNSKRGINRILPSCLQNIVINFNLSDIVSCERPLSRVFTVPFRLTLSSSPSSRLDRGNFCRCRTLFCLITCRIRLVPVLVLQILW